MHGTSLGALSGHRFGIVHLDYPVACAWSSTSAKQKTMCCLAPPGADTGFRKGGGLRNCKVLKCGPFAHARDVFSLFMKFGGPPKGGGGADPQDPPPWIRPCSLFCFDPFQVSSCFPNLLKLIFHQRPHSSWVTSTRYT